MTIPDPGLGLNIYESPSGKTDCPIGANTMTIAHVNGIHRIHVKYCCCDDRLPEDLQLIASNFFPLSFDTIESAFTFQLLDDFRLDNLECKVTAYHYYKKLRRLTSPVFPDAVPVGHIMNGDGLRA
jgi:hypothetical protein